MDVDRLKGLPLFADFTKKQLRLFSQHADELSVSKGRILMREGEMAMEVCVVLEGEAEATSGGKVLTRMGPGSVIGEIGVLEGLHRTATVTAVSDMRLAVVFAPEFTALSDEISELREVLHTLIEYRLGRGGGDPT